MSTEVWRYQTEKAEKEKATALSSSEFTLTRTSLSPHNLPYLLTTTAFLHGCVCYTG